MPDSFGVRLRQQRERQHIALTTIAEQTKIKLSLLEELERDDVSHWPTGIFRRAFVRAYAHAIGLDQDVVVREFLEIHPEPPEIVEADPALSPTVDTVERHAAPPMRLRYLVGSALDSLFGSRRGNQQRHGAAEGALTPIQQPGAQNGGAPASAVFSAAPLRPSAQNGAAPAAAASAAAPPRPSTQNGTVPAAAVSSAARPRPSAENGAAPAAAVSPAAPSQPSAENGAAPAVAVSPVAPSQPSAENGAAPAAAVPAPALPPSPIVQAPQQPVDLGRLARLCSNFARLNDPAELAPLLQDVADMVDAVGLVVWAWDSESGDLCPSAAHGYSDRVLAQLPKVKHDADNATAAAFRSARAGVVRSRDGRNGAIAIPIVAPSGCAGVLAIEVKPGSEELPRVWALATVAAAQLARLVDARSTAAGTRERAV